MDNLFIRFWRNLGRPDVDNAPLLARDVCLNRSPGQTDQSDSCARKILLVDDDLIIQRTVTSPLKKRGYQVFVAGDISTALSLVHEENPDLILLDLTFPITAPDVLGPLHDGYFVIEWLRHAIGPKKIPIIIISGTDPKEYKAQMISGGIVACFQKPLDHVRLVAAIDSVLRQGAFKLVHQPG